MAATRGSAHVRTTVARESRIEELRQKLGYPLKQRDPQGSDFWYLRPGEDASEAEETCPIAVGFYPELNEALDEGELQRLLTSKEWQQRIYGHYLTRNLEHKPVMYLLLPTAEGSGQVPLVLPTEGGLRQRNIQTFAWGSAALETRLNRLRQGELPIASKAVLSIPLVERAFYEPIKTAKELAQLLAGAARQIEQIIPKVYKDEERRYPASQGEEGYLHKLLKSFQQELLPTLRLASENEKDYSFADIYAQTIAYALFTARVFSYVRDRKEGHKKETLFDRETAWQQLPETNPFLRRLFQDVSEQKAEDLGDELIGAIADIFTILRAAKMEVILQDFRQKMNREDIVIRFYEDFLAAYKPEMRERRGVYYTPEPVVSYMVRSVDVLLKEKFNKPLGLADPEVIVLDPACGTGTFLLWIFQLIYERFHNERELVINCIGNISWSEYVRTYLLPRICGFELLMAPFAIAHLKLSLFLIDNDYEFSDEDKIKVYLINTLNVSDSNALELSGIGADISQQAKEAKEIQCEQPVRVVIGNPPYSGHSANVGITRIDSLLRGKDPDTQAKTESYFEVDGEPLGEKNPKWLNNDYVKFIRFAQWRIDRTTQGIAAFVTDHSYLDNPTFRGMRQSLLNTFNKIYIYDLHGNSRKGERSPDGSIDENLFDIQQGISINFFVRESGKSRDRGIYQLDLWGHREPVKSTNDIQNISFSESKTKKLFRKHWGTTKWNKIQPISPFYLFTPLNHESFDEYNQGWKITEIFPCNSVGIVTARDRLTIHWTKEVIWRIVNDFAKIPSEIAREKYNLGKDVRDWKVHLAQRDLKTHPYLETNEIGPFKELLTPILYRPFDVRYTYYTGKSKGFHCMPRGEIMRHLLVGENLALVTSRLTKGETFRHAQVTQNITEVICMSPKTSNNGFVFPLYLYPTTAIEKRLETERKPNISHRFLSQIQEQFGYTPTPEAIFYYIYAIFHSPTYRSRYAEFLKIDFPRVPLTRNDDLFRKLAAYGEQLVALHLMKSPKLEMGSEGDREMGRFPQFVDQGGKGTVDPGHPKYANGKVTINKKGDGFVGVPEAVWNFYVGGYPVCAKWLKDRKGRNLSQDDIAHYQRIVVALQETITLMAAIDQTIPGFPID